MNANRNMKATAILLVIILAAGIGLFFAYRRKDIVNLPAATSGSTLAELWTDTSRKTAAPNSSSAARTARTTTKAADASGSYIYAKEYNLSPAQASIPANRFLICVNRSYALPAKYTVKTKVCVEAYPEKLVMETTAAEQYRLMYNAAMKDGAELIPYSAYRSTEHQKRIFDRSIQSYMDSGSNRAKAIEKALEYIQLPGCSEHETGLAIDITRPGVWDTDDGFANSKEYEWLQANAHNYGFILRYPKNKTSITQIGFKPWHWRYVGLEDAKKMKASGQCLEEYTGFNA